MTLSAQSDLGFMCWCPQCHYAWRSSHYPTLAEAKAALADHMKENHAREGR